MIKVSSEPCGDPDGVFGHSGVSAQRLQMRTARRRWWLLLPLVLLTLGCAKYNTYHNAKRNFDQAENIRREAIKKHEDLTTPVGAQKSAYELAIKKGQKVLDEYPGHSLTDDVLFLQGKAHHRLESYRQSIRKFELLFQNYPATPFLEESLYLQALNYLLIGALDKSQDYLDRLAKNYPESQYQAETRKVSGDNAFVMQDWEEAAASYREYLGLNSDIAERDRVGLKLAECYWELEDYYRAAEVLQDVSQESDSAELAFRARLLRARVHVRMQDFEIVELLLGELRDEAEIYRSQGEVLLVEAESLIARGDGEAASPLLESMPAEWENADVKARSAEILGDLYLARGEWDEARTKFQAASVKRDVLEDEDRVRQLNDALKDYLAAEQALPDATGDRVARLKLLQANALLFGFDRPHMAATLYGEAGADTAADTTVAARALYGAYITYDNYLDLPDSGAIYREDLQARFPTSPQAFEARADSSTNLLGFLLSARETQQELNLAALSPEELDELSKLAEMDSALLGPGRRPMEGVRRRMIYLARRDNLVFPPPDRAVQLISERHQERILQEAADAARQASFDSLQAIGAVEGELTEPGAVTNEFGVTETNAAEGAPLPVNGEEENAGQDSPENLTEEEKDQSEDEEKDDEKEKKKKKRDENWDFLR